MLYADCIILIDKARIGVSAKLEVWRQTLEFKGVQIEQDQTRYLVCNFSDLTRGKYGSEA